MIAPSVAPSELKQTPEYQAARVLDLTAGELEALKAQLVDRVFELDDRIRALKERSREMRALPFEQVRHG